MVGLERPQLAHERVEVGVADLGLVERVVALVVVGDLGPQRLDPLLRVDGVGGSGGVRPSAQAPSESRVAADWSLTRRPTSDVSRAMRRATPTE